MPETANVLDNDKTTSIITIPEGKICDYIDGKFRNDTPEEYVRQNIEKRLVNELKYSKERIKVEDAFQASEARITALE